MVSTFTVYREKGVGEVKDREKKSYFWSSATRGENERYSWCLESGRFVCVSLDVFVIEN